MSLKSTSSSRILQLESSLYPENPPKQNPPPLTLTPVEPLENDGPGIKGFWLFKKNNQNRAGPKNVPSKRVGVGAPSLERSWSEPNSPTELTYSGFTGRENSESKVNYISKAEKLLEESKVRFYGNMKPWEEFSERFKNLFSNGRPAGGKLVKPHTPVHGAQAIARSIVEDMQAALEAMDREMLVDDSSISTTNLKENVRPIRTLMPEPWFEPSTVNPVNFDKVKKPRSINPAGTWHGHSRSRNITIPKPITEFANPDSKNELVSKTDQGAIFSTAEVNTSGLAQDRDVEGKEGRPNQGERERDRGNGKAKEFGQETGSEITYRDRDGEASVFKELEQGRKDGSRHHRNDIPLIEDALRPEPPRERQISDPAIYTRSPYKRLASPDSLSPAVYTLAEDVEVRDGSSSTKTPNGRNIARTPRAPTIVNYPDEDVAYGSFSPSLSRAGSSARTDPLIGGFVVSPLSPVAGVQGPNTPTNAGNTGHRRRRRSRSLNHEFNARSSKDRPKTRDKDRDCERERPRGKVWERDDRGRDRDRDREKEKGKERDRGRQRDEERDREKKVRDRDKDRERDRDKEQDRERGKDKEREREKDKDKYGGTRIKNLEGERDRERRGSGGRRNKDQNRGRDKLRDRDRGKEKERDRDNGLDDRGQKRDRERDRDRDRDRNHKDRNYDHNRAERERLTNPPSPALVLASAGFAPSDATTSVPGAYRDGPIPLGSAASSGTTPPLPPPHSVPRAIYQLGVPMNGPLPPNPASDSRFMEILTSPVPAMHFNLPG